MKQNERILKGKSATDSGTGKLANAVTPAREITRYHLVLFQCGHSGGWNTLINRTLVRNVQNQLDQIITTDPDQTGICIWLDSPGGDAHAAYKLFLDVRSRACEFHVIVPDFAKSAATLLILGADKIYMARAAELGPLDVQVGHPDREGVTVSGLNVVGSLQYLQQESISVIIEGGGAIVQSTELPRMDVLKVTQEFVAQFFGPLIGKLDPLLLHRATDQLRVAERYAVTMLLKRQVSDEFRFDADQAKTLTKRLVEQYPVHEFVISRDEAVQLKLPVENAEDHPLSAYVKDTYTEFCTRYEPIIQVFRESDMTLSGNPPLTKEEGDYGAINIREDPQSID